MHLNKMESLTNPADASPTASATPRAQLNFLFLIPGAFLIMGAFVATLVFIVAPFVIHARQNPIEVNALLGAGMAIGFVYGALLIRVGWRSPQSESSLRVSAWMFMLFVGAFVLVLGVGQIVLSLNVGAAWTFPFFHILASILLSLAVISYAAPRLQNSTPRALAISFTWGGLGTVVISLLLELVALVVLGIVGIGGALLLLGADRLQQLARQFQSDLRNPNPVAIFDLLSSNPALFGLIAVLTIALLSFAVPLIEESAKVSLPAFFIGLRRPTASQALWWALVAGAGYAFSENLLNGLNALDSWSSEMALRGGTSFIHIATTSTLGVGFYLWFVEKKFWRWVQAALIALAGHGIWNFIAIALSFVTLDFASPRSTFPGTSAQILIGGILLVILVGLILLAAIWIMFLVSWARHHDAARANSESTNEMKLSESGANGEQRSLPSA